MLQILSNRLVRFIERFLPDPFVFAILMTAVALILAVGLTEATVASAVQAWGDGLAALLPFIAQMALMVVLAFGLAALPLVSKGLNKLVQLPKSARQAYVSAAFLTGGVALINWPLGLILGSLYAREVGRNFAERKIPVHYPLLAGAAFSGFIVWHMGYSASAPLFVATPGNAMETALGGVISVSKTIFSPWNLATALITLTIVAITASRLHPSQKQNIVEFDASLLPAPEKAEPASENSMGPAQRLEHSRLPTLGFGLLLVAYCFLWFYQKGFQLDLNIVNWTFLALALLLSSSAFEFSRATYSGGRAAVPVLIQYPLYGGVMGIMMGAGLVSTLAAVFARIASEHTLPVVAFFFGGLVNFFIPSGGAQWAVQGPTFLAAAEQLGTDPALIVMGVAYGDQWTNIIHPFTAIVPAIITGLKARQIIAYSAVMFLAATIPLALGLYLASRFG